MVLPNFRDKGTSVITNFSFNSSNLKFYPILKLSMKGYGPTDPVFGLFVFISAVVELELL